jgi:hypothetical protein
MSSVPFAPYVPSLSERVKQHEGILGAVPCRSKHTDEMAGDLVADLIAYIREQQLALEDCESMLVTFQGSEFNSDGMVDGQLEETRAVLAKWEIK